METFVVVHAFIIGTVCSGELLRLVLRKVHYKWRQNREKIWFLADDQKANWSKDYFLLSL